MNTAPPSAGPSVCPSRVTAGHARTVWSKVPEATAAFWLVKVLTTGMGEVVSDDLVGRLGSTAEVLGAIAMAASLAWQFSTTRYRAWPYWLTVGLVSVVGTMVADGMRRGLGLTYVDTTVVFGALVAAALGAWYAAEHTLSIHSITTRRREVFYWCTVTATFALGTAVGDLVASTLGWGFLQSGLAFCALMIVPAVGYRCSRLNAVLAFWWAYVLTRPLGASFADYAWVPRPGGAGLGKDVASEIAVMAFLLCVAGMAKTRNGEPRATHVEG